MKLKVLSGVLLLLLGQVVACPFRVEIISNEHGKTQVNVITAEGTDETKNQTETVQTNTDVETPKKTTSSHEEQQYLGLQLNSRQRVKLAEMILRDSRDYINEETMDVILRSVEAVSRMGSLTLGTSRPLVTAPEETEHEADKLPEPTVIETPATEAPSHTTTYPTFVEVHTTTTTTEAPIIESGWPPSVTTQGNGNNEQTKIIAWWNKMWYGKNANASENN